MFKMLPDGNYCAYLRKSRADIEAEERGEEDTYARHERILFELARKNNITISRIYKERPISGERITERPEMIQLLSDVEDNQWAGVLVVEVERLARGDTLDQGLVAQAFKYSNTFIVTPMRTYDPNDPNDEEYFEFGLFMSRREFKTTTRRLQGGRSAAVKEGKYMGSLPPYGYTRVKLPRGGYSLEPHPDQASIVELIFSLYTHDDPEQRRGTSLIARYLNELNIPTSKKSKWRTATINGILRNPVYIGIVKWKSRPVVKRKTGKTRPRMKREDTLEAAGLHQALVSREVYEKAQTIMSHNGHVAAPSGKISNPFAGLIKCGMCGGAIVLRPHNKTPDSLICPDPDCRNISSYLYIVEAKIIQSLKQWLTSYKAQWEHHQKEDDRDDMMHKAQLSTYRALEKKLKEYQEQQDNLHDLLESKVYTVEVFMKRSKILEEKISELSETMRKTQEEILQEEKRQEARVKTIPKVEHVLSVYEATEEPAQKNALLRTIIDKIVYIKPVGGRWSGAMDKFELVLYPKISKG